MRVDTTEKICSRCQLSKQSGDFYRRKTSHKGSWTYNWCKSCTDDYNKSQTDYAKQYAPRRRELRRVRKEVLELIVVEYLKQNPCIKCGEDNILVLDFDHRDPEDKSFCISQMTVRVPSAERLRNEIAKCDVLCANCHRTKTALTSGNFKLRYLVP